MKTNSSIRSLLGISQIDMAQLLKVHRSQLAMFETGKRDLPLEAKLKLAPILAQAANTSQKRSPEERRFDLKKQEYIKELLQENEFQRIKIDRTLQNIKTHHEKNLSILKLTSTIAKSAKDNDEYCMMVMRSIRYKAELGFHSYNPVLVMKHEIKAEMLEFERLLLQEILEKYTNGKTLKK